MIDQLRIGDKYSYDDFEANVKERIVSAPTKKVIKETVPFSNKTYDFSNINGETYWNERELIYVFEITANTAEELEEKKRIFVDWIMNVNEMDIYDPFIDDYHFKGSFDVIDFDDTEIEKSTITVTFMAYPYMIANAETVFIIPLTADETAVHLVNNSSHRISPTLTSETDFVIKIGPSSYAFTAGTTKSEKVKLEKGVNVVNVQSTSNSGNLKISYYDEVF